MLTADYVRGSRKPYLAPVQLFLIANLIYFAAVSINGWNTLNTNLYTHISWTEHAPLARRMIDRKLASRRHWPGRLPARL